ncbi:MAG TPA: DUF3060 domain-containing protein [Iamia sp.]
MRPSRILAASVVLALGLAGCGDDGDDDTADTTTPTTEATTTGSTAEESSTTAPTSTEATEEGAATGVSCLDGDFTVGTFRTEGAPGLDGPLVGEGGDLTVTFADATWTLAGDGTVASGTAGDIDVTLTVDGEATGSIAPGTDEGAVAFTVASGSGSADVAVGGATVATLTVEELARTLVPDGEADVACTADEVTVTADAIELVLVPAGGAGVEGDEGEGSAPETEPAAAGPNPGVVNDSGVTATYDCGGTAFTLNGSDGTITLVGACPQVTVNGNGNGLVVETADELTLNGDDNQVTWTGTPGSVNDNGDGNTVG